MRAGRWIAGLGAGAALVLALLPQPVVSDPGAGRAFDLRDFALNFALLAPFGIGLHCTGRRMPGILLRALVLSAGIELCQWLLPIGRQASLADVLANTLGSGVAAGVVSRMPAWIQVTESRARHLATLSALLWIAQCAATSWAMAPLFPGRQPYYGQWAHTFTATVPLAGAVTGFSVLDQSIPDAAIPDWALFRDRLVHAETISARVTVLNLGSTNGRAQIAALASEGNLILGLERENCHLRFRLRTRGEGLGLSPQGVTVGTPCGPVPGHTRIRGEATRARMAVEAISQAGERRSSMTLAPSIGWRLLVPPQGHGGALDLLGTALWVAIWGVPVAFWLRVAGPGRRISMIGLYSLVLPGTVAGVGLATGMTPGGLPELAGAVIGWWIAAGLFYRRNLPGPRSPGPGGA